MGAAKGARAEQTKLSAGAVIADGPPFLFIVINDALPYVLLLSDFS